MSALDLDWIPGRGYHFPDGPYVEYAGTLKEGEAESLRLAIERACNTIVRSEHPVSIRLAPRDEMTALCRWVPDNIPQGKPGRVVLFGSPPSAFGVPCGGTHVENLRDIGGITIRKIKRSGENVRVAYGIA